MSSYNIVSSKWFRIIQSTIITVLLAGVLIVAGREILGSSILVTVILGGAALFAFIRSTPRFLLRNSIELTEGQAPELNRMVARLAYRAGLPAPRLFLTAAPVMNAAAIGSQSDYAIIVTEPLLNFLGQRELNAVLAHEISHIKNGDLNLFRFAEILKSITVSLIQSTWIFLLIGFPLIIFGGMAISPGAFLILLVAPMASSMLELALLRTREYAADIGAIELTGDPRALASALQRIDRPRWWRRSPLPEGSEIMKTHPETDKRIRRILEMTSSN